MTHTYHEFEVIRLWEQPTDKFLSIPGLLPFAVLSQTEDPTMVLNQVARAVDSITDKQQQQDITAASAILAGLVLKQDVIRKILRSEIMRESVIYQEILEEGEAKTKSKVALNLLQMGMSVEQIAQVTELSIQQIQALQQQIQQS